MIYLNFKLAHAIINQIRSTLCYTSFPLQYLNDEVIVVENAIDIIMLGFRSSKDDLLLRFSCTYRIKCNQSSTNRQ